MSNKKIKNVRYKPHFKQIGKLKINVLFNFKVLQFKKKKWENFLYFLKSQFKNSKYSKYRVIDQDKFVINKKDRLELNYKNSYFKKVFIFSKIFNLFFGGFSKNYYGKLKKKLRNKNIIKNLKKNIMIILESRLDNVLFKSKFCSTIRSARHYISYGYVNVNNKIIKNKSFILKSGDLISLDKVVFNDYKKSLVNILTWPLTPNYLIVNYKTMEIVFLGNFIRKINFVLHLKLHKLFSN